MKIINYPNYEITEDGTIININTNRIIATCINKQTGYKMVHLWKDNKEKGDTIHRLLAIHFISNPDNKKYVDHIDRNKLNNNLSNLRWVNGTENNLNSGSQDRELHNIYYRKDRNMYRVIIQRYGKPIYLGTYNTIEEAKQVRDDWYASQ